MMEGTDDEANGRQSVEQTRAKRKLRVAGIQSILFCCIHN